MTQDEFIDKWLVGYESREQKEEFVIEMMADLASLQSKGKTKEEVWEEVQSYHQIEGTIPEGSRVGAAVYDAMERYANQQPEANKDGWVSVDDLQKALKMQIEECAVFAQRCARDKGMASAEYDEWIKSTPILELPPKPQI